MSGKRLFMLIVLLSVIYLPQAGETCSAFHFEEDNSHLFGRNYDWDVDDGLIVVNKRHVVKKAFAVKQPESWISKYGSVTFNQYGREFPHGGINEAGLMIALLWLRETQYPAPDTRKALTTLQWVQYQLDNHKTIDQVILSGRDVRIGGSQTPLHFFVCDTSGSCATIEFLKGKMVAHTGNKLPHEVITNNTYSKSRAYLKKHEGFGGNIPIKSSYGSLDRFTVAANLIEQYDSTTDGSALDYSFYILSNIAQGDHTKWRIVYDPRNNLVYFRTEANPKLRWFKNSEFDYSCNSPIKILDINAAGSGDVSNKFVDYTRRANRKLIGNSFKKTSFLSGVPAKTLDRIADFPDSLTCGNP